MEPRGIMKQIAFDDAYYAEIMGLFGYDPLRFGRINFSLGTLQDEDLQRRWLCHHEGDIFAKSIQDGKNAIVSTGFGLSGVPHAGTMSQILRSIALQRAGVPVNMVLGDLDAYNGKAKPLAQTIELAKKYEDFVLALGFDPRPPSILRSQYSSPDVLRTAYLIGHYMDDDMFNASEEDLHEFYTGAGKVDADMSYRRKLSLNLMTADFIHLNLHDGFDSVMVMLGIDEHKYVQFGKQTVERMMSDPDTGGFQMTLAGLYSPLIKGFYGYPKMSKSFPESGITANMDARLIQERIRNGEGDYDKPENNVVYQMMAGVSQLNAKELSRNYDACLSRGTSWRHAKEEYLDMLVDICSKW